MDIVLSMSQQWMWGNCKLKKTKADGIDYPLIRFQFWSMFEDSRIGISLKGSFVWLYFVVVNQGCCRSSQCNLLDSILWLDTNTILNHIYVVFITLVSNDISEWGSVSPIYALLGYWSVVSAIYTFFFLFIWLFLSFSRIVLVTFNKRWFHAFSLDQFLVQVKGSFFPMLFAL